MPHRSLSGFQVLLLLLQLLLLLRPLLRDPEAASALGQ
jgi:hypothetical protein